MRILILTPSLPPAGGAEQVAWELAKKLAELNEVHLLTFDDKEYILKKDNVIIHSLKHTNQTFKYYLTFGHKKVKRIVNEIQPDVINAHMNSVLVYILRNSNFRTVLTLHNSEFFHYNKTFLKKLKHNLFYKQAAKKVDVVTTTSTHMQKYFEEHYQRKIDIFPNGVDINIFKPIESIQRDKKMILHIGRLIKNKRVEIIFELAKKLPDYKFIIIGSGELKDHISLPNLEFKGKVSKDELVRYYNKAYYSIFPSVIENFPLVGIEAMACGSIVIASKKGFSEYIRNSEDGYTIDHPNTEGIINIIMNSDDKSFISQNAIVKAKSYSWTKICDHYLNIYQTE